MKTIKDRVIELLNQRYNTAQMSNVELAIIDALDERFSCKEFFSHGSSKGACERCGRNWLEHQPKVPPTGRNPSEAPRMQSMPPRGNSIYCACRNPKFADVPRRAGLEVCQQCDRLVLK